MHVGFIARLPTAAVNPEDNGQVLALGRRVHIEGLKFVRVLGVGDVAVDILSLGRGRNHDGDEETNDMLHGVDPCERQLVAIHRLQIAVLSGETAWTWWSPM